jgi:hypothetical protein
MKAWRASLLRFDDDGQAVFDTDGLLVTGPDAAGRRVVIAVGAYHDALWRPLPRRAGDSTCPAASSRRALSTCTSTTRRPT